MRTKEKDKLDKLDKQQIERQKVIEHLEKDVEELRRLSGNGDAVAEFYANVFGLEKAFPEMWRSTGRFLTDGTINLAILGDAAETRAAGVASGFVIAS